jgi:hypothetical protein
MKASFLGACLSIALIASLRAQTVTPKAFGTSDYTVTTIAGIGFVPGRNDIVYSTTGSLGRFVNASASQVQFFSALDLPAGAVIDFIGFNNNNDGTPNVMAVHLFERDDTGTLTPLFSLDNTPHSSWVTDINPVPLGILWQGSQGTGHTLTLEIEIAPSANTQFFGQVEVWWKRSVSPAPATATFGDVPTSDPFFQYVEALAASGITGGCGGGNYCPNNPVTRAQMAVFLAKALGLHWPQ